MNLDIIKKNHCEKQLSFVNIIDILIPVLLALCPILQHYKGFFLNLSSEILIICSPYFAFKIYKLVAEKKLLIKATLLLIVYALYVSVIHGITIHVLGRELILVFVFICIENKCLKVDNLFKAMVFIAELATLMLIIQNISYYVFSKHLQLIPTGLLVDSAEQWKKLAETGRISVTGHRMAMYRPSAFFLEPSHFTIYCVVPLVILALRPNAKKTETRQALFISFGILLTTSGMGLFSVLMIWMLYLIFRTEKDDSVKLVKGKHLLKPEVLYSILILIVAFVVLYFSVGVFKIAVNRIFTSTEGNNAIQGRTISGIKYMKKLNGISLLIGAGSRYKLSEMNISGFFYTLVKYGLAGGLIIYSWYIKCLRELPRELFWLDIIVVVLSFFTVHTYAAFYRLMFISFMLSGLENETANPSKLNASQAIRRFILSNASKKD